MSFASILALMVLVIALGLSVFMKDGAKHGVWDMTPLGLMWMIVFMMSMVVGIELVLCIGLFFSRALQSALDR